MKPSPAHVWYDPDGVIIAVGYLSEIQEGKIQAIPLTSENQTVLEVHLLEEQLLALHLTHQVDVEKHCLIERTSPSEPAGR